MPDLEFPPPFFILGASRSGTTLLSAILDSHSRIAVYIESHYYPFFRPDLHRYGDLGQRDNLRRFVSDVREVMRTKPGMNPPTTQQFLDALVAPTFEGVFATMLQLYARQKGKLKSGEKTPGHHAYLGEILENFPESPVIFVMRDPRDAVPSMRQAFGTSLKRAISEWNDAFESYQRASGSVHLVRYEEFVGKPAEHSAALCALVGEPYEPEILRFYEKMRQVSHTVAHHHRGILGPIDSTLVGRFRQMPRDDIEWIESGCAAGMEALGYEFAFGKRRAGVITRPGRVNFFLDRLRFYGVSRRRWWRAWTRWRIVLRVRATYLVRKVRMMPFPRATAGTPPVPATGARARQSSRSSPPPSPASGGNRARAGPPRDRAGRTGPSR
jgi:hypothetical protein